MEGPKCVTYIATIIDGEKTNYELDPLDNKVTKIRHSEPYNSYCTHCNLNFDNLIEYELHNVEMHGQKKIFTCSVCNAIFRRQDHLKRHIRSLHSNMKFRICPVCEIDCTRRDLLLKHIKKKHASKDEVFKCRACEECDFKCSSLSGLDKHENGHLLTERHICPHCDKTFKRRDHMLRHVKSQHLNQSVSCPVCGQAYKRKDHVVRHVREKHQMGLINGRLVKSADLLES